jgi:hypothetical protein
MFHELFHFVLVNGVRVASALLPAAPLLGQKLPSASVKNPVLVHGAFADDSSCSPCNYSPSRLDVRLNQQPPRSRHAERVH